MQAAPKVWVISAGIGAAVVLLGGGGWLWARSRRRGVRVRVSVELEGLTERLGVQGDVEDFIAACSAEGGGVEWLPCPRIVLAEVEVASALRLQSMLATSLATVDPFQVRTIDLGVSPVGSSPQTLLSAVADAHSVRALEKVRRVVLEAAALVVTKGVTRDGVRGVTVVSDRVTLGVLAATSADKVREWVTFGARAAGKGGGSLLDPDQDAADEFFLADEHSGGFARVKCELRLPTTRRGKAFATPESPGGTMVPALDVSLRITHLTLLELPPTPAATPPSKVNFQGDAESGRGDNFSGSPGGESGGGGESGRGERGGEAALGEKAGVSALQVPLGAGIFAAVAGVGGGEGPGGGGGWQERLVSQHKEKVGMAVLQAPLYDYVDDEE